MPRGQKSKLRAREKRRKAREETQGLKVAHATAAEKEECPSSSPVLGDTPTSSLAAGIPQKPQEAPPTTTAAAAVSCTESDEGAKCQGEENASFSQATTSTESSVKDPVAQEAGILMHFMLHKYKMREPIMKADMLKVVDEKYKDHFTEILNGASRRLELVFGLDLKEDNPSGHTYTLVSKLNLTNDGNLSNDWDFPRNGLLMPLLGVIFLNGNSATEEEIWKFMNMLGAYDGEEHIIYGEPRKFITQDLVQEKYLKYKQVPNSDPPRYQFLWGPRAYAETTKMKVLEFLAKMNGSTPRDFPSHYEEALRDEEERARVRSSVRARRRTTATTFRARSRAPFGRSSHPM
ncbi:melanoma-associated antigen B1 [Hylobates moloch]|uniref:melanoma-associated antigen B1 n=1 Tax=Hylobates moloch TaxID=81572 RepID=UPI0013F24C33|nr:melanoma-associated antigen B1 [Hylobates moloch]